jgi:hypothetical protein
MEFQQNSREEFRGFPRRWTSFEACSRRWQQMSRVHRFQRERPVRVTAQTAGIHSRHLAHSQLR